jgi:alanyl-tRNA synthetase
MKSAEIRRSFLEYFQKNGHEVVRSSPLVPQNDPTLMFTNAGMVQFKDVFTGKETRPYSRATSSQKCVRAGGKHNDLENVGRTARHHTFFEMLGNFSFGDYFKEGAIVYAWEWLTKVLGIDARRLVITVFGGEASLGLGPDDEARAIWKKVTGFGDDRIIGMGMKDNFWMMGDTGPQGPCSEIHYFIGDGEPTLSTFGDEPAPDGRGWMEIWNLVFMQFDRAVKDGPLTPLPKPSIDTGAGLERVAAVVEGVTSNYDTDLLRPLVEAAARMAKKTYTASMNEDDVSMRVLADHCRATSFLIADGVLPSNEGRGYTLRRIMRRAIRHAVRLGIAEGEYRHLCEELVVRMSAQYPELTEARGLIGRAVEAEDVGFRRTLDRGLKLLDDEFARLPKGATIPGETVFKLYDTYGFPADLTRTIADEKGYVVDEAGFQREMEVQRARSADFAGSGEVAVADVYKALRAELGATEFLGYTTLEATQPIAALLDGKGARIERAEAGSEVQVITRATPFYGESGGQVGDTGRITGAGFTIDINDTQKPGGELIVMKGKVTDGEVRVGAEARLSVDRARREAIKKNHSATHLLHWALRKVLGDHVAQKGSLVAPDRLRFDFSHFQPIREEEKLEIERLVNQEILHNHAADVTVTGFDEAKRLGAMALFGEKYGEKVRVLRLGENSVELCGGTHVERTGDIGFFKLTTEAGIAQGVRRVEAVTGTGAVAYVQKLEEELARAAERTRTPLFQVAASVEKLQKDLKDRDRKIEELQRKLALGGSSGGRDLMERAREVAGIRVLSARSDVGDPKALREVADQLRNKLKSGVVVLGGVGPDGKVALVAAVTPDLVARVSAGKIISSISPLVGGKGGGKPDLAQGGGSDASKLDEALESVYRLIA